MNCYYLGTDLAKLNKNQVAAWMTKESQTLVKTNEAFRTYYLAFQKIKKLSNSTSRSHISLASAQAVKLKDLAESGRGYMLCSGDLKSIFEYYYNHNGTYTEDNQFVQATLFYPGGYCTAPRGIVNFFDAYKAYAEELDAKFRDFDQYAQDLITAKKNNNWNEIGKNIGKIKDVVEKSSDYLWLMPLDASKVSNYVDYVKKWTGGLDTVYSFLNNYNTNRNAGMSNSQAILFEGVKEVIKKVPMFGSVYVMALESVPGLVSWAKNQRDKRENQIRALGF